MSKRKSEYEVELVLARRRNFKTRKIEYLVKWKGYTSSENQWVAGKSFSFIGHHGHYPSEMSQTRLIFRHHRSFTLRPIEINNLR